MRFVWNAADACVARIVIAFALTGAGCSEKSDDGRTRTTGSGTGGVPTMQTGGAGGVPASAGGRTSNMVSAGGASVAAGAPGTGGARGGSDAGDVSDAGSIDDASSSRDANADVGAPTDSSCLDGITDFGTDGPFTFETRTSGSLQFFVPAIPTGCKVPVVHLEGATAASCNPYVPILQRLATHGFLGVCQKSVTYGVGTDCITALEAAFMTYPELADRKIGALGHEQGGRGAFLCVQLAEAKWGKSARYAGLGMAPASGTGGADGWKEAYAKIKSPIFMFSGMPDPLVPESWVQQSYEALSSSSEAYWYSAVIATTQPISFVPLAPTQQVAIPWFRWKLLNDRRACEFFKQMPAGNDWDPRRSQNESPCQ